MASCGQIRIRLLQLLSFTPVCAATVELPDWPDGWSSDQRLALWLGVGLALITVCIWSIVPCIVCRILGSGSSTDSVLGKYRIPEGGANVRSGPSLYSEHVATIPEGEMVDILEKREIPEDLGVRARIRSSKVEGWISLWAKSKAVRNVSDDTYLDLLAAEPVVDQCPSYWNSHRGFFQDVGEVSDRDRTAVQVIFDFWAAQSRVDDCRRMRTVRVYRNEHSAAWTRYANAKAQLAAVRPGQCAPMMTPGTKDYASYLPMSQLQANINETYLFCWCDGHDLTRICTDGFPESRLLSLAESPYLLKYDQQTRVEADTIGLEVGGCWDPFGLPSCFAKQSSKSFFIVLFRASVGSSPAPWSGPISALANNPDLFFSKEDRGFVMQSQGPSEFGRFFYTTRRELVYPEYIVEFCVPGRDSEFAM